MTPERIVELRSLYDAAAERRDRAYEAFEKAMVVVRREHSAAVQDEQQCWTNLCAALEG